jgi:hypothetical protein
MSRMVTQSKRLRTNVLLAFLLAGCVPLGFASFAQSTTWVCPQADGTQIYSDHVLSSSCQKVGELPTLNQPPPPTACAADEKQFCPDVEQGGGNIKQCLLDRDKDVSDDCYGALKKRTHSADSNATTPSIPAQPLRPPQPKATRAVTFTQNSRIVHALGFIPPAFSNNVQAYNALPGATTPVTITVKYLADGSGPKVTFSNKFKATWQQSAKQAVMLAAQVVTLSLPTLEASFTIEATPLALLFMGNNDGPSAGGLLTVGVIAALLNDPIDPTVCMTGTIQPNLTIGPIGAVPQKMLGCKGMKATRMLIPYGQKDTAASRASVDTGIELIEIRTLAEAYELVTGKPLRKLTDN